MHTKSEKISKLLFCRFLLIRMERNDHITPILVYCSVKCLFCFKLIILKVQEVSQLNNKKYKYREEVSVIYGHIDPYCTCTWTIVVNSFSSIAFRLTRLAYSIPMPRRPSSNGQVVSYKTFEHCERTYNDDDGRRSIGIL